MEQEIYMCNREGLKACQAGSVLFVYKWNSENIMTQTLCFLSPFVSSVCGTGDHINTFKNIYMYKYLEPVQEIWASYLILASVLRTK